ncbi:MAG: carboxypeptidase-like regulatory domain-containing protein [Candidatus Methylomirabilales bacterium]
MKAWRKVSLGTLALLTLWGCATARISERRVLTGLVTDEAGSPVARTPVLLVGRTLDLNIRLQYQELGRKELRTLTDEDGRYRFEFVPAEVGNHFVLFFYDREGFDSVKFQKPDPLDVTKRLKTEAVVTIDQILRPHPNWGEVERLINTYGPNSDRGKILRQLGLPERREAAGKVETWWYYSKGQSFRFSDGSLEGTFQFEPIQQPR